MDRRQTQAYVSYNFPNDSYDVHMLWLGGVVQPVELVTERPDELAATTPAAFTLPEDLARSLFDALGTALGIYTPDARMAAKVLSREQDRVDKFIDHITNTED